MTEDVRSAIRTFALQFRGVLSDSATKDVEDWCDNAEWLLALETLAEHLFERKVHLDADQRRDLGGLVERCGADRQRFAFILDG